MNPLHNGSFWFDSLDEPPSAEPPESLPDRVDVAIIGGGYTGLWTAYYLSQQQPELDIAVFEAVDRRLWRQRSKWRLVHGARLGHRRDAQ